MTAASPTSTVVDASSRAGMEVLVQKLRQALTALPIGPPEALMTSSLMSDN
jgi:hypothetical protein